MPDYDFSGLSSRSFEQLVQALASKVLGPGTVLFGDGPDGGREAVFEGSVPFPAITDRWSGYLVVQAKFRQTPRGDQKDFSWLIEQTSKELKKYKTRKRSVKRPDYYILATNISLSGVVDVGGKDKLAAHLTDWVRQIGLKDFRVWDAVQIRAYLDDAEDIRRAYAAWITPSDVLAKVLDQLYVASPEFLDTMALYLQKELTADTFVNLEQAGHSPETRTLLAKVFVDLPISRERYSPPFTPPSEKQHSIVKMIVDSGDEKLDPASSIAAHSAQGRDGGILPREPGRFVIVGGPGQGKTTVGQLIAQLYRVTFLRTRELHRLSRDVRDVLDELAGQCRKEKITLPLARRFPLRVVLSTFAATAASSTAGISLLGYLADHISKRTDRSVSPAHFRRWLSAYPWILILDGLDEVPGSSNRDEILRAVKEFLVDVANDNADILIVTTTRPQGYNHDFAPEIYQHWWLLPLSVDQALHYARRLIEERYRTDEERQSRVLDRLERATKNPATARLMQNPLLITILAALLDQIGQPPRERWLLFHEYYRAILRREMDKPTEAASILSSYRSDVDIIHRHAGLLLQILSEETGRTEAHLTTDEFCSIITDRLISQGHQGEELISLTSKILNAAGERLVFMVGLEEGKIGFEIRSLQEFMAGEALGSGEDEMVRRRLHHLGGVIHWRNVFLFVAGRCFAEREYLSETIQSVCAYLNDVGGDRTLGVTRSGSRLALELLEDGAARAKPRVARLLVREALHFLEIPAEEELDRLARCYDEPLRNHYEDSLRQVVRTGMPFDGSAWALLLGLGQRQIGWAAALAYDNWPTERTALTTLVRLASESMREDAPEKWLQRVVAALPQVSPEYAFGFRRFALGKPRPVLPRWVRDAVRVTEAWLHERPLHLTLVLENEKEGASRQSPRALLIPVKPKEQLPLGLSDMPNPNRAWRSMAAVAQFLADPGAFTLAQALERMADAFPESGKSIGVRSLPWPLAALVSFASSEQEFRELANKARSGKFGDLNDWLQAESRWLKDGVTEDDLLSLTDTNVPFDKIIGRRGVPHGALHSSNNSSRSLTSLVRILRNMPEGRHRSSLGSMILYSSLSLLYKRVRTVPNDVAQELIASGDEHVFLDFFAVAENIDDLISSYGETIGRAIAGKYLHAMSYGPEDGANRERHQDILHSLCRLYNSNKHRHKWLLRPIAVLAVNGATVEETIDVSGSDLSDAEQAAAVVLKVSQGRFDPCDADVLSRRAIRDELGRIGVLTGRGRRTGVVHGSVVAEKFLHAMWAALEPDEYGLRVSTLGALDDLIGRRRSDLLSLEVWESMGFPRSLRDVGVTARERAASARH